jgi:hypothetical protein
VIDYTDPRFWDSPRWHPDYGDVEVELDHLRNVAQCVIEQLPQLAVGLSVPEEGVMFLVVGNDRENPLAEIYSIELNSKSSRRKYGVFLRPNSISEEERYTLLSQEVISLLKSMAT